MTRTSLRESECNYDYMNSEAIFKCPICGTNYDISEHDECPVCAWEFQGHEDILKEDEKCPYHLMTIKQAKDNYAKGLNIWGKPIQADTHKNK